VVNQAEFVAALPEIVWYLDETRRRPSAGAAVLHRPRGPQGTSRWCCPARVPTSCSAATTIYREPLSLRPFRLSPSPGSAIAGQGLQTSARWHARQEACCTAAHSRSRSATTATRAASPTRSCGRCCLASVRNGRTPTSPRRCTPHPTAGIRWRGCKHIDLFTWLRGDILVKADQDDDGQFARTAGCRFWIPRCSRWRHGLPADQKITRATTKFALRKALEPIVPAHVLNRPKLGFPVPIRHWLRAGRTAGLGRTPPSTPHRPASW